MWKYGWLIAGLAVIGLGVIVAANWWRDANDNRPIEVAKSVGEKSNEKLPSVAPEPRPKDYIVAGGISRPKSDVEQVATGKPTENFQLPDPGTVPYVKPDANASVKLVHEAIQSKDPKLAYRTSVMLPAPEFNEDEFLADPDKYLTEIAPGRVWQSAEPGEGVIPIARSGKYINEVLQGESVNLEVVAAIGYPVTFYSPRLGKFENELSVISVRADEKGVARATFKASTGTQGEIEIFATSPVHSGQARFLVDVTLPKRITADVSVPGNGATIPGGNTPSGNR